MDANVDDDDFQQTLEFLEFKIPDREYYNALCEVFTALQEGRQKEIYLSENQNASDPFYDRLLALFDNAIGLSDKSLAGPVSHNGWTIRQALYIFLNQGEYDLLSWQAVSPHTAKLEFLSYLDYYGDAKCIEVIVEAFGCHIIRRSSDFTYLSGAADEE